MKTSKLTKLKGLPGVAVQRLVRPHGEYRTDSCEIQVSEKFIKFTGPPNPPPGLIEALSKVARASFVLLNSELQAVRTRQAGRAVGTSCNKKVHPV
jgi:hypothetical protein